jgi:hypothetical protein
MAAPRCRFAHAGHAPCACPTWPPPGPSSRSPSSQCLASQGGRLPCALLRACTPPPLPCSRPRRGAAV